eukprot:CAMPEP_0185465758 /NCGR_PEP_ID=MMETSP1365-20130426/96392_1 /TAXON_ID=38817 /ORGANISM="Gephyrocapsa oceanica, Strain RCC1303" /LENGTH=504 /DNA_ID=CAMNT_0028072495 /DNA_START=89 /DNA_END=1600 /DNA_ORIENTATION=-
MSLRRTVDVPGTAAGWHDVTDHLVAALPPVPSALATVRAPSGYRLALIDPAILAVGPACDVAPRRLWAETVSLAVRDGSPLLPCSARLLVLGDGDPEASWEGGVLDVSIEAADPLLEQQRGAAGGEAFAQAALRTALAAGGADAAAVAALETAEEPSPASRVYETFVARWAEDVHGEALLPAARRAAHHILHLFREQAAAAAAYLRNNDAAATRAAADYPDDPRGPEIARDQAVDAGRARQPAHRVHLVLDNVRSAYNVGSIFRTADTARCAEVVTCGFTPHPPNPKLAKTAFGALESVPTRHAQSTLQASAPKALSPSPAHSISVCSQRTGLRVCSSLTHLAHAHRALPSNAAPAPPVFLDAESRGASLALAPPPCVCAHPPNTKLAKTAFGALESVPTRHAQSTLQAVRALQAGGVAVYAMETTERSQAYSTVAFPPGGVALVLGNEQIGVDTDVLAAVDGIVEIPTFGVKNSLNVASAATVVVFEVLRQWGLLDGQQGGTG